MGSFIQTKLNKKSYASVPLGGEMDFSVQWGENKKVIKLIAFQR
jgi:hypothetical protein